MKLPEHSSLIIWIVRSRSPSDIIAVHYSTPGALQLCGSFLFFFFFLLLKNHSKWYNLFRLLFIRLLYMQFRPGNFKRQKAGQWRARSSWIQWHFAGVCVAAQGIQLMATSKQNGRRRLNDGLWRKYRIWYFVRSDDWMFNTFFMGFFLFYFIIILLSRHRWERGATVTSSCARLLVCVHLFFFFGWAALLCVGNNPAAGSEHKSISFFIIRYIFTFSRGIPSDSQLTGLSLSLLPRGQWPLANGSVTCTRNTR